jgi:glycosyltransferase involved in cell wall biosynthesis
MSDKPLPVSAVIFSKDRSLQLEGLLRSFALHCWDAARVPVHVLYTVSTPDYQRQYEQVSAEYPWVHFVKEERFRADLQRQLQGAEHVFFLVDDTLFVRGFAMQEVLLVLQRHPEALGFSFRLGRNTVHCYPFDKPQGLPVFEPLPNGMVRFAWPQAELDFGYPLEVSSSLYRAKDILPLLDQIEFTNPNTLEEQLARQASRCQAQPFLLGFTQSAAFSLPINRVQSVLKNRVSDDSAGSADALARRFAEGQRIDAASYAGFVPNACHQETELRTRPGGKRGPTVSVIVPCYNQAQYVSEAVESVVAQTYSDWELIVVNDGSVDKTSEVVRSLAARHPGRLIRLLERPNGGLAEARNSGIRAALGRYILPLDADDKIAPAMLQQTTACLEADPAVAIAYTDGIFFGAVNRISPTLEWDFGRLCAHNFLLYSSLFRRDIWGAVGGYNPNMTWGYEDWDFWIACGEKGFRARRVPAPLFFYRVKHQSMYTAAIEHDLELRARIVLNHPALYNEPTQNWARAVWEKPSPTPATPSASVPHEILCRAELLTDARKYSTQLQSEIQALQDFYPSNQRSRGGFWRKFVRPFGNSKDFASAR